MTLQTRTFADLFTFTRASTGNEFNSSGVLTSKAVDTARFDYDPGASNAARGILIEGQRTNLLLQSQDMTSASWSKLNCTAALNQTDLFGASNAATRLTSDNLGSNAQFRVSQAITISGTNAVMWGVFRAGTVTNVRMSTTGLTTNVTSNFDLSGGTVLSGSDASARILSLGSGRYLCWMLVPVGADPTGTFLINGLTSGGSTTFAPLDGTQTIDILASGIESGNFPTSVIKTEGGQVTRSADVTSMTGADFSDWFNNTEGTFVVEFTMLNGARADRRILEVSDGTANNRISIYENGSAQIVVDVVAGGVTQASLTAHTITDYTAVHKLAFAYAANDFAVVVNNGTPATDASGSVPTVDRLHLGCDRSSANQLQGHIRDLKFYNERKTNAEMGTLTT